MVLWFAAATVLVPLAHAVLVTQIAIRSFQTDVKDSSLEILPIVVLVEFLVQSLSMLRLNVPTLFVDMEDVRMDLEIVTTPLLTVVKST
jgi:hypothetical protein